MRAFARPGLSRIALSCLALGGCVADAGPWSVVDGTLPAAPDRAFIVAQGAADDPMAVLPEALKRCLADVGLGQAGAGHPDYLVQVTRTVRPRSSVVDYSKPTPPEALPKSNEPVETATMSVTRLGDGQQLFRLVVMAPVDGRGPRQGRGDGAAPTNPLIDEKFCTLLHQARQSSH